MARNTPPEPRPVPPATVPEVTDADVTAAQTAAKEAMELIAELEERVISGDDTVTADQIAAQESLGRFARLRAAATLRKATDAKEAARLRDCQILHDEMAGYAGSDGQRLAELYQAIYDAREEFRAIMEERNETVASWYRRATALDVARDDGRPTPKVKDGLISLGRSAYYIKTDSSTFGLEDVDNYLGTHEKAISFDADAVRNKVAALRKIDTPDLRTVTEFIYRGPNGAILERDQPFTDEEVARTGVRRITAAEAWPE